MKRKQKTMDNLQNEYLPANAQKVDCIPLTDPGEIKEGVRLSTQFLNTVIDGRVYKVESPKIFSLKVAVLESRIYRKAIK